MDNIKAIMTDLLLQFIFIICHIEALHIEIK